MEGLLCFCPASEETTQSEETTRVGQPWAWAAHGPTWRHETDLLVEQSGKETETGIIDGTGDSRGRDGAAPRARRGCLLGRP